MRPLYFLIGFFLLFGCDPAKDDSKSTESKDVVKQYNSDGSLKNKFKIKDGKRHGIARSYYRNGKVQQEINYAHNIKHGLATTYYKTGIKYMETEYDSGEMHGFRHKYRKDGKLMASIPYYQGMPAKGLKEYLLDGTEKTQYPEIKIKVVDEILLNNRYTLKLSVTNASRKVQYYTGKLDKNGCIPNDAVPLISTAPGKSEVFYSVPPGTYRMEELNLIALAYTKLGNPYIAETKFNVAVENRGY